MADGLLPAGAAGVGSNDDGDGGGASPRGFADFLRTRRGLLSALAVFAGLSLALVLALNFSPTWGLELIESPFIQTTNDWLWFATATCLFWLPVLLLLLDPPDNMATGPGLALPLATLGVMAGLVVVSIVFRPFLASAYRVEPGGSQMQTILSSAPIVAFLSFLALAFVARIWNAALFGRYAHSIFRSRQNEAMKASAAGDLEVKELIEEVAAHRKEQGNAEAVGAVIATVAVVLIALLAAIAGSWDDATRIGRDVGLIIAGLIVGIFAVVFLLDWLAELPPVRALGRAINGASHYLAPLAAFYNFIDLLLVRIGAHVAGAGHNDPWARYAVLAGTQLCLAVMTWFLPDPLGLIPAFLSLTLALGVSRLWAWVEEDRNLALITQFNPGSPRRIGFKEDYRDEAIFGFIFVLAVIPMALKQADAGGLFNLGYFQNANHDDPLPWFVYFCFELAKALPIIDWADIYLEPGNFDTLQPTDPWGQHATFLSRALVDLVLVAALLQAISITLRNRQQKALYASHQIDRLDELVEREELRKAVSRPKGEWFKRGLDFRHYSPERLRELHSNTADPRRKEFIETIFEQSGHAVGYALEVLEKLAKRRAPVGELEKTLKAVDLEHKTSVHILQPMDFEGVFDHLRGVEGLRTFKARLLDFAEEIGAIEEQGPPTDLADLLEMVIFSQRRDQFQYTRVHAAKALTRIVPRLPESERVSTLLANLKAAREEIFGRTQFVPEQLEAALIERLREIGPPSGRD